MNKNIEKTIKEVKEKNKSTVRQAIEELMQEQEIQVVTEWFLAITTVVALTAGITLNHVLALYALLPVLAWLYYRYWLKKQGVYQEVS